MPTNISLDDYCKNPSKFTNSLDDDTISSWNQFCQQRKRLAYQIQHRSPSPSSSSSPSHDPSIIDDAREALIQFIHGMLSPEGIEMISMQFGITYANIYYV